MFLKVSRIVKRRPLAKEICDSGRVKVNGHPGRSGKEIKVGDEIEIRFGQKTTSFEVLSVPARSVSKKDASELFRVISEEKVDPLEGAPRVEINDEED